VLDTRFILQGPRGQDRNVPGSPGLPGNKGNAGLKGDRVRFMLNFFALISEYIAAKCPGVHTSKSKCATDSSLLKGLSPADLFHMH
jgi:hypothetical protein